MQVAEAFEPEQQATELVLPTKHRFNGVEPLLEDRLVENWLAAAFCRSPASGIGVDVWHHAAVEDRLPVPPAVVDAVKAHDRASKINAYGVCDTLHYWQHLTEERRFVLVAGCGYKRRDHIAIPVAKSDDLV